AAPARPATTWRMRRRRRRARSLLRVLRARAAPALRRRMTKRMPRSSWTLRLTRRGARQSATKIPDPRTIAGPVLVSPPRARLRAVGILVPQRSLAVAAHDLEVAFHPSAFVFDLLLCHQQTPHGLVLHQASVAAERQTVDVRQARVEVI